ncbi:condensin-2 complex subunit H2-like [Zingiber officinale]|uniref:Condensin-2 complex subunit H2 n=1 Tax=Zingiber officinale TaxID=94328 RepID=A0A8J5BYA6_ZINOF|nr:condensin-2 complex subunit H2-like [Zingiber officinale]KAG6468951.1 hypothetical protein ZIOFF_073646 [Zingiber officinale]
MNDKEHLPGSDEPAGSPFQFLQPNRNLQTNWEVDLAKKLEEYLLKICSGEVSTDQDHELHSVNFAEAALLLQGSAQIYSRKVEYLYSLVLHVLEFLSQKRQLQNEKDSNQPDGSKFNNVLNEENESFLELDDVPVEAKISLVGVLDKNESSKLCAKPPANLLVLEGDCLDSSGDGSELESYLLATCAFYGDFLLLDPSDARAVYDFSRASKGDDNDIVTHTGTPARSKTARNSFNSPTIRSLGAACKSNFGKNQGSELNKISENNCAFEINNDTQIPTFHIGIDNYSDHDNCQVDEPNFGCSTPRDESDGDDDDPWKPLNPHELGNLKVKPNKRIKEFGRQIIHYKRQCTQAPQFPIVKPDAIVDSELPVSFESQKNLQESQSLPIFEKLRRTLISAEWGKNDGFCNFVNDHDDNGFGSPDFSQDEIDLPNTIFDEEDVPLCNMKGDPVVSECPEAFQHDNHDSHASLEDLCRSHLDALLANIAETQTQTELAARVSTWKQRIEHTLEEEETRPPFDIHLYGERIMDKAFSKADADGCISFSNIVNGQPKHEIARTFSALLQLVNNGNVDLQKAPACEEFICHTAANPFYVRLCGKYTRRGESVTRSARKRVKSPFRKGFRKVCSTSQADSPLESSVQNGKFSIEQLAKGSIIRLTPDGKRRRRSARLVESLDLQSSGG